MFRRHLLWPKASSYSGVGSSISRSSIWDDAWWRQRGDLAPTACTSSDLYSLSFFRYSSLFYQNLKVSYNFIFVLNLILNYLISICLVMNPFLNWFFFYFLPSTFDLLRIELLIFLFLYKLSHSHLIFSLLSNKIMKIL